MRVYITIFYFMLTSIMGDLERLLGIFDMLEYTKNFITDTTLLVN